MAPNGIRHKADAVKPQIPKPRPKLSVPRPGGQGILQGICFEDHRLRNDLYCVEWGVKLYSLTPLKTNCNVS